MKVDLEEVESMLLQKQIDPIKVQQIVTELEKVAEELKEERKAEAGPKQKWEFVIVLDDKEELLKGKEIAGWVVQQPSGDDANLILSKLADAAKNQNEVTKKKANKITDLTSLFEHLKSKFTKEKKVRIKTKELTRVLVTNGKLI
jgi:5,10-methenyltetrahydromethanopterin hydrogenase